MINDFGMLWVSCDTGQTPFWDNIFNQWYIKNKIDCVWMILDLESCEDEG